MPHEVYMYSFAQLNSSTTLSAIIFMQLYFTKKKKSKYIEFHKRLQTGKFPIPKNFYSSTNYNLIYNNSKNTLTYSCVTTVST